MTAMQVIDTPTVCTKTGKLPFETRGEARQRAISMNSRFSRGKPWRAYKCPHCDAWHIGREHRHGGKD
jgi:hypothetical protein